METREREGKRGETVQVTLGQELQTRTGGSQGHIMAVWRESSKGGNHHYSIQYSHSCDVMFLCMCGTVDWP